MFGRELQDTLCTDTGADANLAEIVQSQRVQATRGNLAVNDLVRPVVFHLAVGQGRDRSSVNIECHQKATLNIEMHVRHCSRLMLWNIVWMISKQSMAEPFLGRFSLEVLALNTNELLAAASDRLNGNIDVDYALQES